MGTQENIRKAVLDWFKQEIPNEIATLAQIANSDLYLYNGPVSSCDECTDTPCSDHDGWEGFPKAVRDISRWAYDNLPSELYYENWSGCVQEEEPDPEQASEYYKISRAEILVALFGKELVEYLR